MMNNDSVLLVTLLIKGPVKQYATHFRNILDPLPHVSFGDTGTYFLSDEITKKLNFPLTSKKHV